MRKKIAIHHESDLAALTKFCIDVNPVSYTVHFTANATVYLLKAGTRTNRHTVARVIVPTKVDLDSQVDDIIQSTLGDSP